MPIFRYVFCATLALIALEPFVAHAAHDSAIDTRFSTRSVPTRAGAALTTTFSRPQIRSSRAPRARTTADT